MKQSEGEKRAAVTIDGASGEVLPTAKPERIAPGIFRVETVTLRPTARPAPLPASLLDQLAAEAVEQFAKEARRAVRRTVKGIFRG